jgi:dihydroneopterin aldolase
MVKAVEEINIARHHVLIESFAEAIANDLLARFSKIRKISVRVGKLNPPGLAEKVSCAAIELTKARD